jgi:hypothetical protein
VRAAFRTLFDVKGDAVVARVPLTLGTVTVAAGVLLAANLIIGDAELKDLIDHDLEVDDSGPIVVVTAYYDIP